MRTSVRNTVIALLAVALLAWFLRNAHLGEVWREIRRANAWLVLFGITMTVVNMAIRGVRWQYLLAPVGETHFRAAFRATMIGFAASAVLPARAGEVIRPYLLARQEGLSATATFATVVVERVVDTMTVVLLLAAFVLFFDRGVERGALYQTVQIGGLTVGAISVAGLAAMFVAAGRPGVLAQWALKLERLLPGRVARAVAGLVKKFSQGLAVVRSPRRLLAALALSLPLWLSIGAGVWAVCTAFRIDISFPATFLLLAMLVVGVSVPTPGGVGGFHEMFRLGATTFFGAPNDRAVGAAIVLHAVSFLPVVGLGLAFVVQDGLSLTGMRRLADIAEAEGESG
jgi:hypothetical protein